MASADTILGKIGKHVGEKLQGLKDAIDNIDINNISGDVDVSDGDVHVTGNIDGVNLTATGDLTVGGHLECDSLLVKGETKVINTNIVEFSDNILLLNKQDDGSTYDANSGIAVNVGTTLNITTQDVFDEIDADQANDLLDADIVRYNSGTLPDNTTGYQTIDLTLNLLGTRNIQVGGENGYPVYTDLGSNYKFATRYDHLANDNRYYALIPFWSTNPTDTDVFGADEVGTDTIFNNTTSAYLRGFRFRYATSGDLWRGTIRTVTYTIVASAQPQLIYKGVADEWSLEKGSSLGQLNAIFNAQSGQDVIIGGDSLGDEDNFDLYMNDSINT